MGPAASARARALVTAHHAFVWRMLRRLGVPAADVDDAAQQVFWIAFRKIRPEPASSDSAFLLAIALRVAADRRRAQKRRQELQLSLQRTAEQDVGDISLEENIDRERALRLIDRLLESLPWEQRVVFVLFEIEEKSSQEIAAMLELPLGTVSSRLRRAREAFQKAVARQRARETTKGKAP